MHWTPKKNTLLPLLTISSFAFAVDRCPPADPAPCYSESCCTQYCLGPEPTSANAPVRPFTCDGDFAVTIAGFYWNAHQDGMEYAVESSVNSASQNNRYNVITADYLSPNFKWDWGFKVGIGYNTTCDGWDLGILWTNYRGKASSSDDASSDENETLLPLWSNQITDSGPLFATAIDTNWKLGLNLIDLELGREFWVGRHPSLRPLVGIRIGYLKQDYTLEHKGGSWLATNNGLLPPDPDAAPLDQNNSVSISNDFKSVGVRSGLNSVWNLGCGFAVTGDMAFSILYGKFSVGHNEDDKQATSPSTKVRIFEADDSFRTSVKATDLAIGLQWSTLFCDCAYGFAAKIAWEHHLFENQNQMWRVNKTYVSNEGLRLNNFNQRRGDLSTQGWTLTLVFDF